MPNGTWSWYGESMKLLGILLVLLAVTGQPDPVLQLASNYCLSSRLGQLETTRASALLRQHLSDREGRLFVLRLQQLAVLQFHARAVSSLNRTRTAAERAQSAEAARQTLPESPGLPCGDLSVVPHLPLSTYFELVGALYREVAPDPVGVDRVFLGYAGLRQAGLDIAAAIESLRPQLAPYRPLVSQAIKVQVGDPGFPDSETQLWGAYFELRWQHEGYLSRWEAHVSSLYLLMLTHLAELDYQVYPATAQDSEARRAGEEAGRAVIRTGGDLNASLALVEDGWEAAGRRHFAAFRDGYRVALRAAPGPTFAGPSFRLRVPAGWLLQPTPADLHLVEPDGDLEFSVWSYELEEGLGPEAMTGLVDAKLREDARLSGLTGPFAYGLTGYRWAASRSDLGSVCQVISVPVGPPPSRTCVLLFGIGPRARQDDLLAILRTVAGSLGPARPIASSPPDLGHFAP